jgi:hypothetical protein
MQVYSVVIGRAGGAAMIYKRTIARLRAQDWLAIVIELAIVIIGVFIGTQVSNWNQDRIARREAREMLAELKPGLQSFLDFFDSARQYYGTTGAYARSALAGWRSDPSVSDEEFVIAAYQASQIYTLGLNAVNWAQVFGGDRMDKIDDPALHAHLANLMTLNFDQIDTPAISTPYREHVRQVIPDDFQDAIRAKCGDKPIPGKPLTLYLPATCHVEFPSAAWDEAASELRKRQDLIGELRWHRSAVSTFLSNMQLFDQQTQLVQTRLNDLKL